MTTTLLDAPEAPVAVAPSAAEVSPVAAAPVASPEPAAPAQAAPVRPAAPRDLFIDSMRALALLRVFLLHLFGLMWLPLLFPSMSIMFAMAGSLMAGSLDRRPGGHWRVLRNRMRRLLPPLWLLGAVLVPVMLFFSWDKSWPDASQGFSVGSLIYWIVPFQQPPGSAAGEMWVSPLWYVRVYMWFMLLSPAMLWLFRRWPKQTMAVPLSIVAMFGLGIIEMGNSTSYELRNFSVYLVAWFIGFAHHDGILRRMRARLVLGISLGALALSIALMLGESTDIASWNLEMHPFPLMLHGVAFTLIVLRFSPPMGWATRIPGYVRLVAAINARAMTIYLWGNVAISVAFVVFSRPEVVDLFASPWLMYAAQFVFATGVLVLMVMATGWAEDLAARRKPRIIPATRRPARPAATAAPRPAAAVAGTPTPPTMAAPTPVLAGASA